MVARQGFVRVNETSGSGVGRGPQGKRRGPRRARGTGAHRFPHPRIRDLRKAPEPGPCRLHPEVDDARTGEGGDGAAQPPARVTAGARVLFTKYAGDEIENDGHKYLVLQRSEVLAGVCD